MLCLALILNNKDHDRKGSDGSKGNAVASKRNGSAIGIVFGEGGRTREKCKKKENCFFIKGISCFGIKHKMYPYQP